MSTIIDFVFTLSKVYVHFQIFIMSKLIIAMTTDVTNGGIFNSFFSSI